MARRLGISPTLLSDVELGRRRASADVLERYRVAGLDVQVSAD